MITKYKETQEVNMLPGLTRRNLIVGISMMICEFTFEAGVQIPTHSHPQEQVGYVVRGRVNMTINGETTELGPGDSYCAPSGIPHSAYTLEPTIIIDTFTPHREDYLK
jgi:quercetin dioxygenase-like cupin family protein